MKFSNKKDSEITKLIYESIIKAGGDSEDVEILCIELILAIACAEYVFSYRNSEKEKCLIKSAEEVVKAKSHIQKILKNLKKTGEYND